MPSKCVGAEHGDHINHPVLVVPISVDTGKRVVPLIVGVVAVIPLAGSGATLGGVITLTPLLTGIARTIVGVGESTDVANVLGDTLTV